jgi:hypothetical protein
MPNALKTVTLNSTTVTLIPNSFFQVFTSIETVNLSNTFTSMGTNVFNGATSLNTIKFPNALTNINTDAFFGTTSLQIITLPSTISIIGLNAFRGMNTTSKVYFEGSKPANVDVVVGTFVNLFGTNTGIEVFVLESNIEGFKTIAAFNELFNLGRLKTYTPGE